MTTTGGARSGTAYSTVRGTAESIVALPYQLGYQPQHSLVMVCLEQRPGRPGSGFVTLTARVDLAPERESVTDALAVALRQARPDVVLLIAFEEGDDDATELLRAAEALAQREGAVVDRAARVRGGRWLSLDEPDGSQPHWRELPAAEDVPVVADFVLQGRSPLPDRQSLCDAFRAFRPLVAAAAEEDLRLRCDAEAVPCDAESALSLLGEVLREQGSGMPELSPARVVDLALLLHDVLIRDAVLAVLAPGLLRLSDLPPECGGLARRTLPVPEEVDDHACRRVAMLTSVVPAVVAPPLLSVCGYLAWCRGEGTLANVAVERALAVDPDYSLARLLDGALQHAVRPPRGRPGARAGAGDAPGCPPAA
ncbi:DUF4192 domain-containing protein [Ornithinimicrobium sediminis]|uniref:DUF4192 domain-containing protein n=1 Tax=Ornithinimicrobium sediminis TaxID=2904603 RepID=UPI001E3B59F7|nr:DUF4192 domain-containing protein [Ornithinimicrobium sediminis]MCE0488222.1 DUF4192 domain-containing protein [Ornithinimicrobium sediminis]